MSFYQYRLYDFCLSSDLELPGLPEGEGESGVVFRTLPDLDSEISLPKISGDEREMIFAVPEAGIFRVREGREILFQSIRGSSPDQARAYLLGMVLGGLLHQRGFFVLHASCVSIEGRACLFAGQVGAGKSTLANNLLKRGGLLLADDITAIRMEVGAPIAQPGFYMMRLDPKAVRAAEEAEPPSCPQPFAKNGKKGYLLADRFDNSPRPLKAIYLIQFEGKSGIERISGQQCLIQCLPHLYVNYELPRLQSAVIRQLGTLLQAIPAFLFTRDHGLNRLDDDCALIKNHFASL